ncbi:uncharacterized protein B0P05DRAFT_469028 [Gilbertella persicaria]|uniref:uncharacterized protein n=1 Tax=Gilbertella persicaria TaxID=101096 RepID=UPI0022206E76|nr:uncharacterized protein B0P05DRAFT_469028 [Gilbertella persicaria]KAI8080750.1 hypothetical protein B0P05DRAFT_469028 [Gilbertella persicaria]
MSFPLFGEKILYEDIKFISWCPTTDLVLFVSPLNHLFLYRNGVDLVWSVEDQIDSDIRVTTWNPNGKEFVLGCEDGTVYKVDIRYHSPSISPCWHETNPEKNVPITSLVWTNYNYNKSQMKIEGFDSNAFDLESALPLLSNERPLEPLSRFLLPKNKRPNLPNKPVKHSDTQTLLFIGDQNGRVHTL